MLPRSVSALRDVERAVLGHLRDDAAKPTPALAAANAPVPGTCHASNKNDKCDFGDKCIYKHIGANGNEVPKPKANAKPKAKTRRKRASKDGRKSNH